MKIPGYDGEVLIEGNKQCLTMDTPNTSLSAQDSLDLPAEQSSENPSNDRGAKHSEAGIYSSDEQYTSFSRDLCSGEPADPESRKRCEAHLWQLFQLVERQCQDQIFAQQEQFNNQIQIIRDELKHFIQLQSNISPTNSSTENPFLTMEGNIDAKHFDDHQEHLKEHKMQDVPTSPLPMTDDLDMQYKTFITQEQCVENISVSSGYGTRSVSEPHTCSTSYSHSILRDGRKHGKQRSEECRAVYQPCIPGSSNRVDLPVAEIQSKEVLFTMDHNLSDNTYRRNNKDRSDNKPLTTWAQKFKQSHQKKLHLTDEASVHSIHTGDRDAVTQSENTDGSSDAFYLNNRSASANSLVSTGSGFTYWTLDEKEMYHPLPENLDTGLSKFFSTKESDETRIPSLTDLYQQKQRESVHYPDWKLLSPSEYIHPPEVLTLDPTLHRKPLQSSVYRIIPFTPDSILENSSFNHYKAATVSAATSVSSLLGDSPNSNANSPLEVFEEWKSNLHQSSVNQDYKLNLDPLPDERAVYIDDEINSLPSSPMAPSPLPAEKNTSESTANFSMDHPLVLSNIRQSLREKHARHLADLRDYYESEISSLKQQLLVRNKSPSSEELNKINSLSERCCQLEAALTEASTRIHFLENKNHELDMQVAEWKERHQTANNTCKALQEHSEELRAKNKENENSISRLQSRLKEKEEAFEKSFRLSEEMDARIKKEHKKFQNFLSEYESLGKEHERVKDTLHFTENKLCVAHDEIHELKRSIVKLEGQIKQLEHEHMVKLRQLAEGQIWQSSAKCEIVGIAENVHPVDVTRRKCVTPGAACSVFTDHTLDNKASEVENMSEVEYVPKSSPPEKDVSCDTFSSKAKWKDCENQESPILKALRDLEEDKKMKSWGTQTTKENVVSKSGRRQTVEFSGCWSPCGSPGKHTHRHERLNSPSSPRSSSVPPSNRKSTVVTPTKRELMLAPVSVKYSPKRSPRENFSPGLSQLLSNDEDNMTRFDVVWDDSLKNPSPRKKLEFMSLEDPEVMQKSTIESESSSQPQLPILLPPYETEFTYKDRMKYVADTERLFDELSHEKQQIEAALSRLPSSGGRLSLQMRVKKERLEDRLEKINRDLGSVRMTLKKCHVLPTSTNI
ncbi:M-phase phosphoprotein 9 isoform X2 [Xenopus laevis]|uniref:M-phase phosphoprotein 9 isoform X2 n=1 Tax=Xenopus laevis TaxID=8355 RepID=A0A8J0V6W9_XENLA|nr:M-phase phosphoprotein 9 isoform X2 [Xenopus laevis]